MPESRARRVPKRRFLGRFKSLSPTRDFRPLHCVYEDSKRPGRYVGEITIAGKRRRVSGPSKTDVRAKLRALQDGAARGEVDDRRLTVADAIVQFLERDVPNRRLAPSTIDLYRWTGDIIVAEIGKVRLANLTVGRVEKMLDRLASRDPNPLGRSTLTKVRGTLQRAITFAERRGLVSRDVAKMATITPDASASQPRSALVPDDARRLLAALRGERLGLMFALSLRLGLRPGEAAGLHWGDVDVDSGVVNITRARRQLANGAAEVVDDLKTRGSKRAIGLPGDVVVWFTEHRRHQTTERLAATSWGDNCLVFTNQAGEVVDPSRARRTLADICRRADVPVIKPNELRHTAASLLSDEGVPLEQIADLLGHASTAMLEATYRHRLRPVVDVAARATWAAASE